MKARSTYVHMCNNCKLHRFLIVSRKILKSIHTFNVHRCSMDRSLNPFFRHGLFFPRDLNGNAAIPKSGGLLSARFHFRAIFGEAAFAGY